MNERFGNYMEERYICLICFATSTIVCLSTGDSFTHSKLRGSGVSQAKSEIEHKQKLISKFETKLFSNCICKNCHKWHRLETIM